MAWSHVQALLEDTLIRHLKDPSRGAEWLKSLELCDGGIDGLVLGCCIAIDVASGALRTASYIEILDNLGSDLNNARTEFAIALAGRIARTSLTCASRLPAEPLGDGDRYARVMELGDFITYYAGPTYHYSLDPADVAEVQRVFFDDPLASNLGDIKEWWTGRMGNVWVLSYAELLELEDSDPTAERGFLVLDALGLNIRHGVGNDGKPILVAVLYPPSFDQPCVQPTSLDSSWQSPGGFYLSHKRLDGWGRTHSCSGNMRNVRERVHRGFKGLTEEFTTHLLGPALPQVVTDSRKLVNEADRRANEAIKMIL